MKTRGFTLIEVLLVITVLAVIASVSVIAYRRVAETTRVQTAATEMRQILQSALAYDVDQHGWPESNDILPACQPREDSRMQNFIKNYVPNQSVVSRFGFNYCWGATGTHQRLFWVALAVPGHNQALARRLASALPNAITTSDPTAKVPPNCDNSSCYVRAEVPTPGSNQQIAHQLIVGDGNCTTGALSTIPDYFHCQMTHISPYSTEFKIYFKACPDGMQPKVVVAPNFISLPDDHVTDVLEQSRAKVINCDLNVDEHGYQTCGIQVVASVCTRVKDCRPRNIMDKNRKGQHQTNVGASYVVSCVPQTNNQTLYRRYL